MVDFPLREALRQRALFDAKDAVRQFVIDGGHFVPSAVGAENGPLEGKAIRSSWLRAVAAIGMTEDQAIEARRGLWKRGKDSP